MGSHGKDLSGQRFGRLTAISPTDKKNYPRGYVVWRCLCDCGEYAFVDSGALKTGGTKSCGCIKKVGHYDKNGKKLADGLRFCTACGKVRSKKEFHNGESNTYRPGLCRACHKQKGWYIKAIIKNQYGVGQKDCTKEMVALKRTFLKKFRNKTSFLKGEKIWQS